MTKSIAKVPPITAHGHDSLQPTVPPKYRPQPIRNPLSPYLHIPQALCAILSEQLLDEVLGGGLQVPRPLHPPAQDLLVDAEGVVVKEGRVAG